MNKTLIALGAALLSSPALADTLVSNVNGIQVGADGRLQHFGGLLIGDDGRVKQLIAKTHRRLGKFDRTINGQGRTLLPGLIDAHGHVMAFGLGALQLDLTGSASLGDMLARLNAYAPGHMRETHSPRDAAPAAWVIGRGWNQELWPDKTMPTARDLDRVVRDVPVWLGRVDGHAAVGNSAALRAAGITAATPDPAGGKIERDAAGNPTGLMIDAATELVERKIPPPTPELRDQGLRTAQATLLKYGITAVADMGTSVEDWNTMRRAGDDGESLQVRILSYAYGVDTALNVAGTHPTPWLYDDKLRMVGVKFYADGALGSRGAWLKQPYADKPDTRGLQFHSDAELAALVKTARYYQFQVAIHAIGDAANAQVISIFEQYPQSETGNRFRIEHTQIVDPADIPRIARSGIIASMQPTHQTSDRLMAEKRLGPNRLGGAYAWRTILNSGARLAFGSDFPVESPNPFPGLAAAVSRQDLNGQPPGGWRPQETLTLAQALAAFTRGAAYAGFAEDRIGGLDPGMWADFILVDRDPTKVAPQALARTQVLETWVGGKKAWAQPIPGQRTPER